MIVQCAICHKVIDTKEAKLHAVSYSCFWLCNTCDLQVLIDRLQDQTNDYEL